eukprot:gene32226-36380_t
MSGDLRIGHQPQTQDPEGCGLVTNRSPTVARLCPLTDPARESARTVRSRQLWRTNVGPTEGEGDGAIDLDPAGVPVSDHPSLTELDGASPFVERHIGLRPADEQVMLERLGFATLSELMDAAVPGGIRSGVELELPTALTEHATAKALRSLAAANRPGEAMIGLGYHATITPPVVRRNVLEDPSWYTAYTPYQPEISQGRLEALINFQT